MMQELEAEASRKRNLDRDAAWKTIGKSFNKYADAIGLTGQRREAAKKRLLDAALE